MNMSQLQSFVSFTIVHCSPHSLNTIDQFLGASPQTPWVGFAEFWVETVSSAKKNNAFLLFLENEEVLTIYGVSGGTPPDPLGRLRRGLGRSHVFCEAEQRFLLLFLEKEVGWSQCREASLLGHRTFLVLGKKDSG
jgi:hypothetical protein